MTLRRATLVVRGIFHRNGTGYPEPKPHPPQEDPKPNRLQASPTPLFHDIAVLWGACKAIHVVQRVQSPDGVRATTQSLQVQIPGPSPASPAPLAFPPILGGVSGVAGGLRLLFLCWHPRSFTLACPSQGIVSGIWDCSWETPMPGL